MASIQAAHDFVDFVTNSPTPFHAVASASALLEKASFQLVREQESWVSALKPGGKYFLTRNGSTICAFAVGKKWSPGNPISMVGAHTDSPCLRVKPVSNKTGAGYTQLGVENYGGGTWHTWFDRDLSLAGRVLVREGENFVQKLVKVEKPIVRIPNLAIHLNREPSFNPNLETEVFPITGVVEAKLNETKESTATTETHENNGDDDAGAFQPLKNLDTRHHPKVLQIVAEHAGVKVTDIVDFELILYDTQKPCIGGINDEFIFSQRLDNLCMTYCSIMGLIESAAGANALDEDNTIRLAVCFDHEEIGSVSAQGAQSNLLLSVIRRLCLIPGADGKTEAEVPAAFEQSLIRSFLMSADMAHAVNPNYTSKYESSHQPAMNGGPVVKINANQRYSTNSPGIVLIQECARAAKSPLQLFVVRNDSPCGSTIGPALAAKLGVRTLDLGNPTLAMHSIRETAGTQDVGHAINLLREYYASYGKLEKRILID